MKLLIALLTIVGLGLGSAAYANEEAAAAKAADKPDVKAAAPAVAKPAAISMEKISLTGKLTKEEKTFKGKDGKDMKKAIYTLTTSDGTVAHLPALKTAKDGEEAMDYDKYVDKDVTMTGEGMSREISGKKKVMFKSIASIDPAPAK